MPKIITKGVEFTGSIGPVRFDQGEGSTELPAMVAHFRRDPERFDVIDADPDQQPEPDADPRVQALQDALNADPEDPEHDEDPDESDEDHPEDGEHDAADPYDVSVDELRKLCSARQLSTEGRKPALQERLRADDQED